MAKPYPYQDDEALTEAVDALKDDVAATRNVGIKTEHQLKSLSAEIRQLSDVQRRRGRLSFFNSGIAYLLLTALVCAGASLVIENRTERFSSALSSQKNKESAYRKEIAELRAKLGRWVQIERELLEFERLVSTGNKEAAVAKFSGLRRVKFSGLLEGLVSQFKSDVAGDTYKKGISLFEKGSFGRAEAAFAKSLEYDNKPPYLGGLLYYQGMTALRMKDFAKSAQLLRAALDYKHGRKRRAEARYHLAYSHDRLGEKRTARELYNRFVQRHSKHPYAAQAKRRFKQLLRRKRRK